MKLLPHEQKRLRQHATLTLRLSPDTKTETTRRDCAEFTKSLLNTVAQKRQIKHWLLVLVEIDKENE
jgi:hypothetical protein